MQIDRPNRLDPAASAAAAAAAERPTPEHLWVFIDNSNIWIEGQRRSAQRKHLEHAFDPAYRISMKHLLDAIQHQFPTTTIVQKLLVGSVPPPTDAVWAAFEELGLNVETFKRSYWTKKEKQVDNSICMAAQNVIFNLKSISQLTKNPHDPSIVKLWCDEIGLDPARVKPARGASLGAVLIVSGDGDFVKLKDYNSEPSPIYIWSWKHCIRSEYESATNDFAVHFLDDHYDEISYEAKRAMPLYESYLSRFFTVVVVGIGEEQMDTVRDALKQVRVALHLYTMDRSADFPYDLGLSVPYEMTDQDQTAFLEELQALMNPIKVLTIVQYRQRLQISESESMCVNPFHALHIESDDDEQREEKGPSSSSSWPMEHESDGFTKKQSKRNKKKKQFNKNLERASKPRCNYRQFCNNMQACRFRHTDNEKRRYGRTPQAFPPRCKPCPNGGECTKGTTCRFHHEDQKGQKYCFICGPNQDHFMEQCKHRSIA